MKQQVELQTKSIEQLQFSFLSQYLGSGINGKG